MGKVSGAQTTPRKITSCRAVRPKSPSAWSAQRQLGSDASGSTYASYQVLYTLGQHTTRVYVTCGTHEHNDIVFARRSSGTRAGRVSIQA